MATSRCVFFEPVPSLAALIEHRPTTPKRTGAYYSLDGRLPGQRVKGMCPDARVGLKAPRHQARWDLVETQLRYDPAGMPNPPSLHLAFEMSVRQFDFVDRAYDNLTARSAAMIGWMSFISSLAIAIQARIQGPWWSHALFVLSVSVLAIPALVHAFKAYKTKEMEPWPHGRRVYEQYGNKEDHVTRAVLLVAVENAIRRNSQHVADKARHIDDAVRLLYALSILLPVSLFLSFVLQSF